MTTSSASMGGPLSEAELGDAELEWIRAAYAKSQTVVSGLVGDPTGPYAKDSGATAIRDVGRLLAEMDRRKAWLHDELRELFRDRDRKVNEARDEMYAADKKLAEATARVGVLEGQLATARAESTELGAKLKDFLDGQFRIAKVIGETEDKFEQQRLLGLAEARATLRSVLDGCDDFMVPTIRACTGCGKCSYCTARGITAASVLGLDGGGSDE